MATPIPETTVSVMEKWLDRVTFFNKNFLGMFKWRKVIRHDTFIDEVHVFVGLDKEKEAYIPTKVFVNGVEYHKHETHSNNN